MPLNRIVLCSLVLAAVIVGAGCSLDRSGIARLRDAHVGDAETLLDADLEGGLADGGDARDAELPDAELVDAEIDAGVDADVDAGLEDGGLPDSGPPDAGPSPIGCADGTVEQPYTSSDIVGCDGALDQCTAETLCGSGWHLCTYGEYTGRGGDTVVPTTIRWIASCARLPETCTVPARPTDAICAAGCSRAGSTIATIGRVCGGALISEGDCPLGVAAYTTPICVTFGTETVGVFARPDWTTRTYGATCCR